MVFNIFSANNTIVSCFFFFLSIDYKKKTTKENTEIETNQITVGAKINKCSM